VRRFFRPIVFALAVATISRAQSTTPPSSAPPPRPSPQSTVLQTTTELVIVDVVVQDKSGHPVHGLTQDSFHLTESKSPQTLRHFEEHSSANPGKPGPELPPMPPGSFTDYTPVPPSGGLNILLLDALNTPTADQAYVRYQLQQYIKNAAPGTRIAIFGLANRLILLQGFTSDPAILKDVINHKLIPRSSALLDDPSGSGADPEKLSEVAQDAADNASSTSAAAAMTQMAANLQQFEAETAAMETKFRLQFTLDAFNTLAHYLAAFPGRKNLLWFSGSFPINILPDPSISNPFAVVDINSEEFRETTSLLAKAQVAVYPIDARGLMPPPMYNAANSGRGYTRNPGKFNSDLSKFTSSQADEHSTMDTLASDTGGHAFYNTNGLAEAVTKAIDIGSNYYTLAYTPSAPRHDGSYRDIRVAVTAPGTSYQLSYRHGYYADTAAKPSKQPPPPASASAPAPADSGLAYEHAAMARGGPTPQDLLFKVRVLPASTTTETTVAPGNNLNPAHPPIAPFRRYLIDFASLPRELTFRLQPDGHRTGAIEYIAYAYDTDGRLLVGDGKTISLNLPPDKYAQLIRGAIAAHLEISVPTRGDTFLRIGIRDVPTNRFGVVELPVSTVSHLAPPAPSNPAPVSPTPSTSPAPAPAPQR
jgi:VWFA-related protein